MKIFEAAKHGDIIKLKEAIAAGEDINAINGVGLTALHIATRFGRIEFMKNLIAEYKADVNIRSDSGWTPLYVSCVSNNQVAGKLLLNNNADPDILDNNSVSPLAVVSEKGNVNFMQLLLDHKASVNIDSSYGTELHAAARIDYTNIYKMNAIKLLISKGSNVTKENALGHTPRDYLLQDDASLGEAFDQLLGDSMHVDTYE